MRGKIHYNDKGKYKCNPKVLPNKERMTKDWLDVSCVNCRKGMVDGWKRDLDVTIEPIKQELWGGSEGEQKYYANFELFEIEGETKVILDLDSFINLISKLNDKKGEN